MLSKQYEIEKIIMGRLSYDADLLEELTNFCNKNNIKTGWISVIGAVKNIKLGFYDQKMHQYVYPSDEDFVKSDFKKQNPELPDYEISSCMGNISIRDGKSFLHLHVVVSDRNGRCFGGHLMPGTIIYAGEFTIQVFKGEELVRGIDNETNLPLWVE
ncbi:MAG: DNA-binding protein [Candidatus Gastranaerophilales bacterium]|nr:DNA-binding protein [Candidatus Gastranaerophilales bacterium]